MDYSESVSMKNGKDSWDGNPTKRRGWMPCAIVGGLILALLSGMCIGIFIGMFAVKHGKFLYIFCP